MNEEQIQEEQTIDNEIDKLKSALRNVATILVDVASQINKVAQ